MTRIAVVALHRVIDQVRKKLRGRKLLPDRTSGLTFLQAMKQFDLLLGTQIDKAFVVAQQAALVDSLNPPPVGLLQDLEWSAKLVIDVVDDSGPGSARILIGRDDLINNRSES